MPAMRSFAWRRTSNGEPDVIETTATEPVAAEQVEQPKADGAPRATEKERVEIRLPDVGEAENVSVIEVAVAKGQTVAVDDLLVVVESEKASMEIPSPFAGKVVEVVVGEGDDVEEASLLVVLEAERAVDLPAAAPVSASPPVAKPAEPVPPTVTTAESIETPSETVTTTAKVYAGPAVRRLARELGVDLGTVNGSGARGRIVKDDVKSFVKRTLAAPTAQGLAIAPMEAVDFSRFGEIDVVPLSRIRARGAVNLHRSWQHVVHVTQHDDFDVTDLEAFRASLKDEAAAQGVKLTPLPFIMKACVRALEQHPAVQRLAGPERPVVDPQALSPHRFRRGYRGRLGRARGARRGQPGRLRVGRGDCAPGRGGPHKEAETRRNARRQFHDL